MKKLIRLSLVFLFSSLAMGYSQTQTLKGFSKFKKSGIEPIYDGKEVKGYTLFYKIDKADKNSDNYGLCIYDKDLNKVKEIEMKKQKNVVRLLNNCYNGSTLGLFFYNTKEKSVEIETYDESLNKMASVSEELSKMDVAAITQGLSLETEETSYFNYSIGLYPVPSAGFIKNGVIGTGKGYSLKMYNDVLKVKWTFETDKNSDYYEAFVIDEITEKYIIGRIIRRPSLMSRKMDFFIGVFDCKSGEKIIDQPIESGGKEQLSVNGLSYNESEDEFVILGDYYKQEDRPGVDKSVGFYVKRITTSGEEKAKNFYAWNKEIKAKLSAEAKTSIDNGYMNFTHKIVKGADNKLFVICEQYKSAVDGWGVAANVLNGGYTASMTKVVIGNMMVFAIDPDFSISYVRFIAKDKSDVVLPPGGDFYGAGMMGLVTKMYGGFDYQYTQQNNSLNSFNVVYINYDEEKKESTKKIVGNIIFDSRNDFQLTKIDVTSNATSSSLYPAKEGYIMMVDYKKKEKQLEMKLLEITK